MTAIFPRAYYIYEKANTAPSKNNDKTKELYIYIFLNSLLAIRIILDSIS
jgi:hypothetical protein